MHVLAFDAYACRSFATMVVGPIPRGRQRHDVRVMYALFDGDNDDDDDDNDGGGGDDGRTWHQVLVLYQDHRKRGRQSTSGCTR